MLEFIACEIRFFFLMKSTCFHFSSPKTNRKIEKNEKNAINSITPEPIILLDAIFILGPTFCGCRKC